MDSYCFLHILVIWIGIIVGMVSKFADGMKIGAVVHSEKYICRCRMMLIS